MKFENLKDYINSPLPIKNELTILFNRFDNLVIFDIGACEAEDSIRYSKLFPNSKIYAFEPVPENIQNAKLNILDFNKSNIFIHPFALDEKTGETDLHVSGGNPNQDLKNNWNYGNKSSSILPPEKVTDVYTWLNFKKSIKIKTKRLDIFCKESEIYHIDFIHLDVQGAELKVLNGAGTMLEKTKAIWLEVENISLYKNQPLKKDIETFMIKNDFKKIIDNVKGISGDQLYINNNFYNQEYITKIMRNNSLNFINKLKNKIKEGNKYYKKSYSQCGEDLIIKFIFDTLKVKNPSWIDIGANHPFKFNNTALFYELGHTGINVEADPKPYELIKKHRKNDINLNLGISDKNGISKFYIMSSGTLNTFALNEANKYAREGYKISKTIDVQTITINELVKDYCNNKYPELLSIDVEGLDEVILREINYNDETPLVICIETISFSSDGSGLKNIDIINFLKSKGYIYYADTYINSIFVQEKAWKQI